MFFLAFPAGLMQFTRLAVDDAAGQAVPARDAVELVEDEAPVVLGVDVGEQTERRGEAADQPNGAGQGRGPGTTTQLTNDGSVAPRLSKRLTRAASLSFPVFRLLAFGRAQQQGIHFVRLAQPPIPRGPGASSLDGDDSRSEVLCRRQGAKPRRKLNQLVLVPGRPQGVENGVMVVGGLGGGRRSCS